MMNTLVVFLIGLSTFAILFYGYLGYKKILSRNPCEMTYSYPFIYETKYEWKYENYKLVKVSKREGEGISGQPVLFIPGHRGSHVQIRSFASEMHNKDKFFQYFAIDFNNDVVGLHAKDLLLKSTFVNEALRSIRKLYPKADQKVILLGHSYGGMIAKTAPLLSNHPNCTVENIVMLGTPNLRSVHGIDASLTTLYNQVNKAYYTAFYNNASCGYNRISSKYPTTKVSFQPTCTACIKNISLLSLSGGEIDFEVSADATNIHEIAARPRNITSLPPVNKKGGFMIARLSKFMTGILNSITKMFYDTIFGVTTSVTKVIFNLGVTNNITALSESPAIVENVTVENEVKIEEEEVRLPSNSTYHFITKSLWEETILAYTEPRHQSIRTSQIINVGFPMDHYALLWCRELVSDVSQAMRKMSKSQKDLPLYQFFSLHQQERITTAIKEVQPLQIFDLISFVGRNTSHQLWQESIKKDQDWMYQSLDHNPVQLYAVHYFLRHWLDAFYLCLATTIFALSMKVLAIVFNVDSRIPEQSLIGDLLFVGWISRQGWQWIHQNNAFYILFGLFSIVLFYLRQYLFLRKTLSETLLVGSYGLISLCGGLTLRMLMIVMIRVSRMILNVIFRRSTQKSTFNRPSTEEGSIPRPENLFKRFFGKFLWKYWNEIVICISWITLFFVYPPSTTDTSFLHYVASLTVIVYIMTLFETIYLSMITTKNHLYAKRSHSATTMIEYVDEEFLILFFFYFLMTLPSIKFCWELAFLPSSIRQVSTLYESLVPDQIQAFMIVAVGHFLVRRLMWKKQTIRMHPMASLLTLLDKPLAKTACIHEDGGSHAIFEEVANKQEMVINGHRLCIGTTYKVIWCNCKENRAFKTTEEWCEWCKCRQCNPAGAYGLSSSPSSNLIAINLDLSLGIILFAISLYMFFFIEDIIYLQLYSIAYVMFTIGLRSMFSKRTIEFGF